jgi:hypothetical protein
MNNQFKPLIILTILFISFSISGLAQGGNKEERNERVQAAKVSFITTKLDLNTTQAQQFWPMYNEYEAEKKKIRKQMRQLKVDNILSDGTEDQLKADIKKMFTLRQEELDLEKSYSDKFLKVLKAKQMIEFYRAEKEFTKILLKRLKENRKGDGGLDE